MRGSGIRSANGSRAVSIGHAGSVGGDHLPASCFCPMSRGLLLAALALLLLVAYLRRPRYVESRPEWWEDPWYA